jgi:hypothetical protein
MVKMNSLLGSNIRYLAIIRIDSMLCVAMLSVAMLSVAMLSVAILSVTMLSVAMLSVVMLSVVMLIVVAHVKKSGTTVVRTIVVEAKVEKV